MKFSDRRDIDPVEIQRVRLSVGWKAHTVEVWRDTLEQAIAVASAWDGEMLVGVAFLVGTARHAILSDISVQSEYQRRGIARRLLQQLTDEASRRKIVFITLYYDETKPWLIDLYGSVGFKRINNAMQIQHKLP